MFLHGINRNDMNENDSHFLKRSFKTTFYKEIYQTMICLDYLHACQLFS